MLIVTNLFCLFHRKPQYGVENLKIFLKGRENTSKSSTSTKSSQLTLKEEAELAKSR